MRITRTCTVFNQKLKKIDSGYDKLSAYFHQCHLYRKLGNLDHLMQWNIMGIINHKALNFVYSIS